MNLMDPQCRRLLARLRNRKYLFVLASFVFLLSIWKLFNASASMEPDEHYQKRSHLIPVNTSVMTEAATSAPKPVVNPYPYHFTMTTSPCTGNEKLVIAVHSAVSVSTVISQTNQVMNSFLIHFGSFNQ